MQLYIIIDKSSATEPRINVIIDVLYYECNCKQNYSGPCILRPPFQPE